MAGAGNAVRAGLLYGKYSVLTAPRILLAENGKVYVHKDGPDVDEAKWFEDSDWGTAKVAVPALKAFGLGDYILGVSLIGTRHFDSREELDRLYSEEWKDDKPRRQQRNMDPVERITFHEALKIMRVDIGCNMDHLLAHRDHMESVLGRKLPADLDLNNTDLMKGLEEELFHKQTLKIFGREEGEDDERSGVTFADFRLLFEGGNETYATARRGRHYVVLFHVTS